MKTRINNPKPKILQLFCRHSFEWYRKKSIFYNISGETQYKICKKCGKVAGSRFFENLDGS